jgi:hypothetical protein
VSIGLSPGGFGGVYADWWVVASTASGWYSYVYSENRWLPGIYRCVAAPIFSLSPPFEVSNATFPAGNCVFFFAVDDNADGAPDATWWDSAQVRVQ